MNDLAGITAITAMRPMQADRPGSGSSAFQVSQVAEDRDQLGLATGIGFFEYGRQLGPRRRNSDRQVGGDLLQAVPPADALSDPRFSRSEIVDPAEQGLARDLRVVQMAQADDAGEGGAIIRTLAGDGLRHQRRLAIPLDD